MIDDSFAIGKQFNVLKDFRSSLVRRVIVAVMNDLIL
jgi:hypothetical protein